MAAIAASPGAVPVPSPERVPTDMDAATQQTFHAVAKAYWAVPPGAIRSFLDQEVTPETSPSELKHLLEIKFSEEEIRLSGVRDFIVAFSQLDRLMARSQDSTPMATPMPSRAVLPSEPPVAASAPSTPAPAPHARSEVPTTSIVAALRTPTKSPLSQNSQSPTSSGLVREKKSPHPRRALAPKRKNDLELMAPAPPVLLVPSRPLETLIDQTIKVRPAAAKALASLNAIHHDDSKQDEGEFDTMAALIALKKPRTIAAKIDVEPPVSEMRKPSARKKPKADPAVPVPAQPTPVQPKKPKKQKAEQNRRARPVIKKDSDADYAFSSDEEAAPSKKDRPYYGGDSNHGWPEEDEALLERLVKLHKTNWRVIAEKFKGKYTGPQIAQHYRRVSRKGLQNGPWSPEEEELLIQATLENPCSAVQSFSKCSAVVRTRSDICCNYWWKKKVLPDMKTPYTPHEDVALLKAANQLGGAALVCQENLWRPLYYGARRWGKMWRNTAFRTPRSFMKRLQELTNSTVQ